MYVFSKFLQTFTNQLLSFFSAFTHSSFIGLPFDCTEYHITKIPRCVDIDVTSTTGNNHLHPHVGRYIESIHSKTIDIALKAWTDSGEQRSNTFITPHFITNVPSK